MTSSSVSNYRLSIRADSTALQNSGAEINADAIRATLKELRPRASKSWPLNGAERTKREKLDGAKNLSIDELVRCIACVNDDEAAQIAKSALLAAKKVHVAVAAGHSAMPMMKLEAATACARWLTSCGRDARDAHDKFIGAVGRMESVMLVEAGGHD